MVQTTWDELPGSYPGVETDAFITIPNHIHGIIVLTGPTPDSVGADPRVCPYPRVCPAPPGDTGRPRGAAPTEDGERLSLGDVVARFKTMTTKRYADGVRQAAWAAFAGRLWQRNYYEHVIRDGRELDRVRRYIDENPCHWDCDRENPQFTPSSSPLATPGSARPGRPARFRCPDAENRRPGPVHPCTPHPVSAGLGRLRL